VSYAGLESHESHALAGKYLSGGFGSVFTFGLKGGFEAGVRLVEGVDLWSHLANVGDTRSLIIHPASTTHRQLTDEQREAAGAGNDVIRLSVGIESIEDLIADLDQALAKGVGLQGQLGRAGGLASGTTVHEVLTGLDRAGGPFGRWAFVPFDPTPRCPAAKAPVSSAAHGARIADPGLWPVSWRMEGRCSGPHASTVEDPRPVRAG